MTCNQPASVQGGGAAEQGHPFPQSAIICHFSPATMPPVAAITPATLDRVRGALWVRFGVVLGPRLLLSGRERIVLVHDYSSTAMRRAAGARAVQADKPARCRLTPAPNGLQRAIV